MTALEQAYALCRKRAFGHYENFPVASWLLPEPGRSAVAAVYAFARQADDIADEPGQGGPLARVRALKAWQSHLDRAPQAPEFLALHDACRRFKIAKNLLRDLISAFSQDCRKQRYADFGEVLDYCRRSANPVGRLVLRIFGKDSPVALEESDALCTALQLANFWQDLASDAQQRHRIYLPADDMERYGVGMDELLGGAFSDRLRELMRFQVNRTEAYFTRGEGLPARLGGRLGAEIRLTLLGGRRILELIRAQGYDTLSRRPKLSGADALPLAWRFLRMRVH